jgi:NAD(P)-dependent dehydrogenase (short-subunit alcohol dehydrogenase family)
VVTEEKRVALVTGGNRGIGLEVCRGLARSGLQVVMSGRDEAGLRQGQAQLKADGLDVATIHLDITDMRMLEPPKDLKVSFIGDWLKRRYGRIDVLVNNAGVIPDPSGFGDTADGSILAAAHASFELGFATHFYGPLALCRTLVPLMRDQGYGRIVNVSTGMARLTDMGVGWPAYRVSKVATNALTRILSGELQGTGVLVNSADPGWVRTRLGGEQAPLSPQQGADTIVWLATLPQDGPSGGFFASREPVAW